MHIDASHLREMPVHSLPLCQAGGREDAAQRAEPGSAYFIHGGQGGRMFIGLPAPELYYRGTSLIRSSAPPLGPP